MDTASMLSAGNLDVGAWHFSIRKSIENVNYDHFSLPDEGFLFHKR